MLVPELNMTDFAIILIIINNLNAQIQLIETTHSIKKIIHWEYNKFGWSRR